MDINEYRKSIGIKTNSDSSTTNKDTTNSAAVNIDRTKLYNSNRASSNFSFDNIGSSIASQIARNQYDLSDKSEFIDNKENVYVNPVNSIEELRKERANNQSGFRQIANAIVQGIGSEFLLGMAIGVSDLVDAAANIATDSGENDYNNTVSRYLTGLQDTIRKEFAIYQENPNAIWNISDPGWWANNAVSITTGLSFLVPGTLATKGISFIGKIPLVSKLSRGVSLGAKKLGMVKSAARLNNAINFTAKLSTNAIINRTMENYLEARGVWNDSYENAITEIGKMSKEEKTTMIKRNPYLVGKTDEEMNTIINNNDIEELNKLVDNASTEEMARLIAGKSADETFRNDYAMVLLDMLQLKTIGSLWKSISKKAITKNLRRANKQVLDDLLNKNKPKSKTSSSKSTTKTSDKTSNKKSSDTSKSKDKKDNFFVRRYNNIKESVTNAVKHPLTTVGVVAWSEGFEEGYQGIQTEKGMEVGRMILDPDYRPKDIVSYIVDPAIWEQAFWGVVGGYAFQKGGEALGNIYRKISAKLNKDKLTDEDFVANMTAEEKVRAAEIKGRNTQTVALRDKLTQLNALQDPDEYEKNADGTIKVEDGVKVSKRLTPEEAESRKREVLSGYITNLTANAIDSGNYELLKEYLTSQEIDKYFKEAGIEFDATDKSLKEYMIRKMEEVADNYADALHNVLVNTEANESIARITAREIVREQLAVNGLQERQNIIRDNINKLNKQDSTILDENRANKIASKALKKLRELDEGMQELYEARRDNSISAQAYAQYIRDYNAQYRSIIDVLLKNNPYALYGHKLSSNGLIDILNSLKADNSNISTVVQQIESYINNDTNNSLAINEDNSVPKEIESLLDEEIENIFRISNLTTQSAKTQKDYETRVADTEFHVDKFTKNRLNDAAKKVESWIIKQDNLKAAWDAIINNEVKELKEALDILKLGYYSTQGYTDSILATIKEEQARREKEKRKQNSATVDGKKQNEKDTNKIKQDLDKAEASSPIVDDSSTGEQGSRSEPSTQTNTNDTTNNTNQQDTETNNNREQESAEATAINESVEDLNKSAKESAEATSDELSADDRAVSIISYEAMILFRTDRALYERAANNDIDAFQEIISSLIDKAVEKGVSLDVASASVNRGIKVAINAMARRLEKKDNSLAQKLRDLADSIATKQDLRKDMSAVTSTAQDTNVPDSLIDEFLETYAELAKIKETKGQKTIINLERLFNEIVNNPNIDIDINTAFYILYNIKDYISKLSIQNKKYIFTNRRSLNTMLKNPVEFANAISASREKLVQLDNYMHISAPSSRNAEYTRLIDSLKNGDSVEAEYTYNKNGIPVSISFKVNGKEIGYINVVGVSFDNNTYSSTVSNTRGGISFSVTKKGEDFEANTDELFDAIFEENSELWDIIYKYYLNSLDPFNPGISKDDADNFMNHPAIQKAIKDGVIKLPIDAQGKSKYVINRDKAAFIIYKLQGIIFYNTYAQTMSEYRDSYRQWLQNVYTNYKNTHQIQTKLSGNKKVKVKLAGIGGGYGTSSQTSVIIDETEHPIDEVGLTFDNNPVVIIRNDNGRTVAVNEQTKRVTSTIVPFQNGTMGMLIGGKDETPVLAMFTSANKLSNHHKIALKKELIDILQGFQEGKYSFEEVDKKLAALFNGAGVGLPTIFSGYSIVHNGDRLGLQIKGKNESYVLVINKLRKDRNGLSTGISYLPNGDKNKGKTKIKVDNKFIESIANEIVENVTYNKTFYTFNNLEKDNTDDNPYMYKENGKFVINIGGEKTIYKNFGDFALKEKAFNTNQGRNENGGYFDNTDKVESLYIDVSVAEQSTLPVEEMNTSIADTIRTATDKENETRELLIKAGFSEAEVNFLLGDNVYNIPIISKTYRYQANLTGYARYKRNKRGSLFNDGAIYFSNKGANAVNKSPQTLRRLLIHESLHAKFDELNLFEREVLVSDLLDTYRATVEAIKDTINNPNKYTTEQVEQAKRFKDWLIENKFNIDEYFDTLSKKDKEYYEKHPEEKARTFAEEWLVETLSQPLFMRFMNNIDYVDANGNTVKIKVAGIPNEKKSIWQKIIDCLLKLFKVNNGNIEDNTIFARQYQILGNINSNDITNKIAENENTVNDRISGEDTTKNKTDINIDNNGQQVDEDSDNSTNTDDGDPDWDDAADTSASDNATENTDYINLDGLDNLEGLDAVTTTSNDIETTDVANDGGATAETFSITRIANMSDYIDLYSEQDKPLIAKMLANGEINFVCR